MTTLFDPHPRAESIEDATAHADREHDGWREAAAAFVVTFAARGPFTGEDVTGAATGAVPDPPDKRAWGGVFAGLARRGVIRNTGRFARRANGSPMPVWERVGR